MKLLFTQKEERNYVICSKMDVTGDHSDKGNKPNTVYLYHVSG
jgi:hypothetical protein